MANAPNLTTAKIYQTIYSGAKVELEVQKERGLLIYRDEVENTAFSVARVVRDKILSLPSRVAPVIADMSDKREITELLFKEINEILEEISNTEPFQ